MVVWFSRVVRFQLPMVRTQAITRRPVRPARQGNVLEFGVKRIEGGASGTSIGPKHLQWVQLRDRRTRAVFFEVNHHIVPTIESGGHPNGKTKRLALYRQQMKVMLSSLRSCLEPPAFMFVLSVKIIPLAPSAVHSMMSN